MSVDWEGYDRHAKKGLLSPESREVVERSAAELLALPPEAAAGVWGRAVGWGCEAAAVIHIPPGVPHRFRERAAEVAVKVYRTAAAKAIAYQQEYLVGRELPRLQRSFAAEIRREAGGKGRGYVVVDFVPGTPMDARLREDDRADAAMVTGWVRQCLAELVAPLWARRYRFWDVRPTNLVLSPDGRLTLIDNDLLRHGGVERDLRPEDWTVRDHVEAIALGRGGNHFGMLPRLVRQLLRAQGKHSDARLRRGVLAAWAASGVGQALAALGRAGADVEAAQAAVDQLIGLLAADGMIA
jgi:hypothetical protein